jgi:RNA-directed DNA polymerase
MTTKLEQIRAKATTDRKLRFTSLAHLITPEFLSETWRQMNRRGASGVDGETTTEFERELETRVQDIYARLKAGTYQAPPVRRVEIPKGPGKVGTRPLGIPTVEDRLVQRAVARILEAVFEADFLDCSYGFRPGRNPHQALRSLRATLVTKKVRHLYEADIRGYFNHINHQWLMRMVAHRIADRVILRPDWQMAQGRRHARRHGHANGSGDAARRSAYSSNAKDNQASGRLRKGESPLHAAHWNQGQFAESGSRDGW